MGKKKFYTIIMVASAAVAILAGCMLYALSIGAIAPVSARNIPMLRQVLVLALIFYGATFYLSLRGWTKHH